MATQSPNWTIDPVFLDRVETVVDMVLQRGFWAILNVHHDSWEWADLRNPGNYPMIEERFSSLWDQIGRRFACKSSKLIFEPINEPAGDTAEQAAELNKLNDIFLQRINTAGGFNPQRVVSLTGLGHDSIKTSQWFERGTLYPQQPWGLQFHYYSPCKCTKRRITTGV
jgi:endoglucanase